jgi:hypothetical protein
MEENIERLLLENLRNDFSGHKIEIENVVDPYSFISRRCLILDGIMIKIFGSKELEQDSIRINGLEEGQKYKDFYYTELKKQILDYLGRK